MESNLLLIKIKIVLFFLFLSSVNGANRLKSVYYYDSNSPINARTSLSSNNSLKIIVHGFTETKDAANAEGYVTDMKNAILKHDPHKPTVMVVNWDTGVSYTASIIKIVSEAAEDLVNHLISLGVSGKNIHCIGHSLGGQMCGFAGKHWLKKTGAKFARITGLDPSGPNFGIVVTAPVTERLAKDDAEYVDVYHTNSGLWGINYNAGHSDYWVNGVYGAYQPGCLTDETAVKGFCSHKRSWAYFISSIENQKCFTTFTDVTGLKKLTAKFGYWSDKGIPNIYLNTGSKAPFCQ